jgi:hypothetical protein
VAQAVGLSEPSATQEEIAWGVRPSNPTELLVEGLDGRLRAAGGSLNMSPTTRATVARVTDDFLRQLLRLHRDPILHKENVKGWSPNLLDQFDFTKVKVESG